MLYVLPGSLIPAFYEAALTTKPARFEDVYVAGLLATKLNVRRIGLPRMDIDGYEVQCYLIITRGSDFMFAPCWEPLAMPYRSSPFQSCV